MYKLKPYSTLTVRGQARRLRMLAANALKYYDLNVTRLRLVTNDFNGIFRVDTRDGQKYILRVTLPEGGHILDHVAVEMDWLAALARDTDLLVPRPVLTKDGALVVEAATEAVPEPRLCVIFTWAPGRILAEDMSATNIAHLGELMAGLHDHALAYHPPVGLDLLRFDRVFPFPEPVVLFEDRYASLFTPERQKIFRQAIDWAQESINRLQASGESMRIIHGDLHQWNVLNAGGKLTPIDFEDLMLGWPVQDIATTLYYFDTEAYSVLRAAFQEGYTHRNPWPERHPGEIDAFIAARAVGLVNFILNDPNPNWKSQMDDFIQRTETRLRRLLQGRNNHS